MQVQAQDPDIGSNAAVQYSVLATPAPFTVNPMTGVVTTTGALDHETQDQYSFTVEACDLGAGPLCDTALVVINVGDFNDEVPRFDLSLYAVTACDSQVAGQTMVQPIATDRDSGVNSNITYSIDVR